MIEENILKMIEENLEYLKNLKACPICNNSIINNGLDFYYKNHFCCNLSINVHFINQSFYIAYRVIDEDTRRVYDASVFDYATNDLDFYIDNDWLGTKTFNNLEEIIIFIKTADIIKYINKLDIFK